MEAELAGACLGGPALTAVSWCATVSATGIARLGEGVDDTSFAIASWTGFVGAGLEKQPPITAAAQELHFRSAGHELHHKMVLLAVLQCATSFTAEGVHVAVGTGGHDTLNQNS